MVNSRMPQNICQYSHMTKSRTIKYNPALVLIKSIASITGTHPWIISNAHRRQSHTIRVVSQIKREIASNHSKKRRVGMCLSSQLMALKPFRIGSLKAKTILCKQMDLFSICCRRYRVSRETLVLWLRKTRPWTTRIWSCTSSSSRDKQLQMHKCNLNIKGLRCWIARLLIPIWLPIFHLKYF